MGEIEKQIAVPGAARKIWENFTLPRVSALAVIRWSARNRPRLPMLCAMT
jgi:hypothetical protein